MEALPQLGSTVLLSNLTLVRGSRVELDDHGASNDIVEKVRRAALGLRD